MARLRTNEGLAGNDVKGICEAHDGTRWIGTYGGLMNLGSIDVAESPCSRIRGFRWRGERAQGCEMLEALLSLHAFVEHAAFLLRASSVLP